MLQVRGSTGSVCFHVKSLFANQLIVQKKKNSKLITLVLNTHKVKTVLNFTEELKQMTLWSKCSGSTELLFLRSWSARTPS